MAPLQKTSLPRQWWGWELWLGNRQKEKDARGPEDCETQTANNFTPHTRVFVREKHIHCICEVSNGGPAVHFRAIWKGDLGLGTSGKPLQTPACQDCSGAQREADGVIHLSRWGKECWGVLDRGGKGDGQRVVVSPGQFSGAARLTFLARRGTSFACFPSAPAPSFQTNVARKLGRFLRLRHLPICRGRPLKTDRPQRRCQCK
nr:uncharacterized protein LOC105489282 isoform X1 [Macaca nemestrina]XP_011752308.1 uncharacterized protein LOC105489282 isoform X1 [Macaca nemestrina]XP_011752309.1 uncharacterized protein LOC105489282 isoform X1 [Macaca nemestrina]XP_011752310.1 uncharacterized protein LOC105489282 isoform X1 [Macaca nemestrina]XP_011752311.1 uncharacterized protein LOC105489282 isoform X1 [Macaca nemestrina]XP_011752312.1 uncharacterized protein LOC105489282 isoform X1 [Macaca nemestrina]XP_011752313.1 un